MPLIFRHAWLLLVLTTCAQGASWWRTAKRKIAQDPALGPEYRRLIKSFLIYENLPWLVMGAGIVSGAVPSTLHYLNPRNGPFVVAFFVVLVVLGIAQFYWLFFQQGAEVLVAHPGLFALTFKRPWALKALYLLCLPFVFLALFLMIFANIQIPWLK